MAKARGNALGSLRIGEWAFLVGVLLAIVLGLFPTALAITTVSSVLVVLGVIVGLVNIGTRESQGFLVASVALLVAGSAGYSAIPGIGDYLSSILMNISTFVAPAAVIVGLKAIYELARKS